MKAKHKQHRALFGTDGIRGQAGQYPLDSAGAVQVGKAVGQYFAEPGDLILVGRDPRESSYMLALAVTTGLAAVGVETKLLDVLPTPALAHLTKSTPSAAGVMITASHNPFQDNGIKVFSPEGGKLPDHTEAKLNELIDGEIAGRGFGRPANLDAKVGEYEDYLVASAAEANLKGLTIILDMANGATSGVATRVFERLGAQVVPTSDHPDGRNINVNCGATHTAPLQEAVSKHGACVGAAFDGDGDRVMLVDEQGRLLTGDHVLYILAVSGGHKGVVATIMSNMGLENALKAHNIELHRTAVGDRYVLEGLESTGLMLGGEQSGHIIQPAMSPTGDGILAAIHTLLKVRASGRTLAQWYDEVPMLPQKLASFPLPDKAALKRPEVQAYIFEQTKELSGTGRLNVRPSGTEPIARVMVEATDAAGRAQTIADHLHLLTTPTAAPDAKSEAKKSKLTLYQPFPGLDPVIKHLAVGDDPELERQLIAKSKQPHILKFTPNDAAERFSSPEAIAQRKLAKNRDYYWLLGPDNDLAGIIWFGPKTFPLDLKLPEHPIDTFAIRLYENYLGKGLALPFFQQALSIEYTRRQERGEPMSLWGVTDTDNTAALGIYKKVGFRQIQTGPDRTFMVMPAKTITETANSHQLSKVGEPV